MSKYVMCLGSKGRRRSMLRYLDLHGYAAIACDGEIATIATLKGRGLPRLILSETTAHVERARMAVPRLYEVGALSFEVFAELVRSGSPQLNGLISG